MTSLPRRSQSSGPGHDFTRREVLASLLGAPAALLAGCNAAPALPPQGSIVGANVELGHRLRSLAATQLAAEPTLHRDIVIVGGGVAGLTAAWSLKKNGCENFSLLELESVIGGSARGGENSTSPFPWGAHYLPAPLADHKPLIELLGEMGVLEGKTETGQPIVAEQFLCRDPEERLFIAGAWREGLFPETGASPDDLDQWKRFQAEIRHWVAWRDAQGRRAFSVPADFASNDAEVTSLDNQTMADWLDQHKFTSARLRWIVNYACRDDYGATIHQVSAWAGLFYFCARIAEPGAESRPLITWPEGNARLVRHLARGLMEKTVLNAAVASVVPGAGGNRDHIDLVALRADNSILALRARRVIFAAPQFLAPFVIRGYREERARHTAHFEYGSWLVANLHLSARPAEKGFPLAWDNVLYDSQSLGYVVATHQTGRDHGPSVFTWYLPLLDDNPRAGRERLLGYSWSDCAAAVLADLATPHPDLPQLVTQLDCLRWGHAMIRPQPGFRFGTHRAASLVPFRGIHFAHCDLSGLPLFEEAFYQGLRAANEVLQSLGRA